MSPESSLEVVAGEEMPSDEVAEEAGFAEAVSADREKRTLDSFRAPVVG
jgi:hypothetical protein